AIAFVRIDKGRHSVLLPISKVYKVTNSPRLQGTPPRDARSNGGNVPPFFQRLATTKHFVEKADYQSPSTGVKEKVKFIPSTLRKACPHPSSAEKMSGGPLKIECVTIC
ncbi:MAG: hypothetical protein ACLFTB_03515, partial [Desulfovibrionales bacterium]